jgi:methionyl-tRNA formyltransferase
VPIDPNDTTGSLYFNSLFPLGLETLRDALALIDAGDPPSIVQDETLATYEPICREQHARVDFSKSGRDVHNLIRGCDPQPGAYAFLDGRRLRFYEPSVAVEVPGEPGTIVSIGADGLKLALRGASVTLKRVRLEPSPKKVAPAELAASGELKAGPKLS